MRVPSVAWIDWLLYASDVVLPDTFEPVFAAGYWAELGSVVRREGLSVERVFAEHLPRRRGGIALASGKTGSPGERRRGA